MKQRIIAQGAEAKIILSNNFIIKDRIKKTYRIPELDDKIRKLRTRSETKLLEKAGKVINTPNPLTISFRAGGRGDGGGSDKTLTELKMPFIQGKRLSEHLDDFSLAKQKQILKQVGQDVAKLHDANIIHGDLTTSNMIFAEKEEKIYFIDFGLGFQNGKIEDKAVDIHLLKQALEAKHFKNWKILYEEFLKGYKKLKDYQKILDQLQKVEKRGRYRH